MSKEFFYVDGLGKVIATGSVPDFALEAQIREGFHEGYAELGDYVDNNGNVCKIGVAPGPYLSFDYALKEWRDMRSIDEARSNKWVEIKEMREKKYNEVFFFNDHLFQPDTQTIMAKVQVAQLDLEGFSQSWVTADNHTVTLNGDDMVNMGLALDARNSDIFAKSQQLRSLIEAAVTNEKVDAITWNSI